MVKAQEVEFLIPITDGQIKDYHMKLMIAFLPMEKEKLKMPFLNSMPKWVDVSKLCKWMF